MPRCGQIAFDQRRGDHAAPLLLGAARRLEAVNVGLARTAHLDALVAAIWASDMGSSGVREAAEAARAAPPGPGPQRVVDVLLDPVALRLTKGYAEAAPALDRALQMVAALEVSPGEADRWLWLAGGRIGQIIAMELWDFDSWHALATGQVQFARSTGALMHLAFALNYLARTHMLAGELAMATRLVEEDHLIAEATGNPPIADTAMMLAAWRGQAAPARELIEAISQEATAPALHQHPHRPIPPGQGFHQARHLLPRPARPGPARRGGHRPRAVACLHLVERGRAGDGTRTIIPRSRRGLPTAAQRLCRSPSG